MTTTQGPHAAAARLAPSAALERALGLLESRARAVDVGVRGVLVDRPLLALGTAAGVGFVLGGALAEPLLRAVLRGTAQLAAAAAAPALYAVVLRAVAVPRSDADEQEAPEVFRSGCT